MVATRRSKSEDAEQALPIAQPDYSSDDNGAPEEVSMATGKQTAAQQRQQERSGRRQVQETQKSKRKRRQEAAPRVEKPAIEQPPDENEEDLDEDDDFNAEDYADEDLDMLPEDVIEAIAQGIDRRPLERRIVTDQLRADLEEGAAINMKRKKRFSDNDNERRVGPVTVKVLNKQEVRKPSEAAKAFLESRLHGGVVKRDTAMLQPAQVYKGGSFIYGPTRR